MSKRPVLLLSCCFVALLGGAWPSEAGSIADAFLFESSVLERWYVQTDAPTTLRISTGVRPIHASAFGLAIWWSPWDTQQVEPLQAFVVGGGGPAAHVAFPGTQLVSWDLKDTVARDIVCEVDVGCGFFGGWITHDLPPGARGTLMAILASDGPVEGWGTLEATGSPSVSERVETDAYLHREADFNGTNVQVTVPGTLARLVHVDNASLAKHVENAMVGLFIGHSPDGTLRMGYDGPTGSADGNTTYWVDGTLPGTYNFRIDENEELGVFLVRSAGVVFLLGAEVPPWPGEG
jgi:hypothetical protein